MSNHEELVKALRDCASGDGERCLKCTYHKASNMPCDNALMTDAAAAIEALIGTVGDLQAIRERLEEENDALRLEPKRGEIVRCRECKHYNAGFECLAEGYGIERGPDWFCAYGEREVQE